MKNIEKIPNINSDRYIYILCKRTFILVFAVLIISACSKTDTSPIIDNTEEMLIIPKGFPEPVFPESNPYSLAKAQLGRYLYYERMLSKDSSIASCSHCLKQEHAFSDNTMISLGFGLSPEFRNTMTHQNLVYRNKLCWDGRAKLIENNAYRSLFLPYILNGDTNEICRRLEGNPMYVAMFKKAFGDTVKITATRVAQAIATFVRTLISGESAYDKFINGDASALTESQKRGMDIFFSERGNCSKCHSGFNFTDQLYHNTGVVTHYFDRGLYDITKDDKDRGKFLTPTLRNIEMTAPYMHDGEIKSLEAVVNHYSNGGRAIIYKDTLIKILDLSFQEKTDLIEFLKALTDRKFLTNKKFSNPFKN